MWQNILQSFQQVLNKLSDTLSFAPLWAIWAALLVGAFAAACFVHAGALAFLDRILGQRRPYLNRILTATKNPIRLVLLLIALAIALPTTSLGADSKLVFARCLVLATICLIGWIALRVLHIGANLYLRNFRIDSPDNQVTNANPEAIELRILVTAASVSDTSNLCAELREKLIVFLQNECPQALPRRRHEISELPVRRTKGRNTASNE